MIVKFPRLSGSSENTIIKGIECPDLILIFELLFPVFLERRELIVEISRVSIFSCGIRFPQNTIFFFTLILSFVKSVPLTLILLQGFFDLFITSPVIIKSFSGR